ncbi:MAG: hypothetical protein ACHP7N_10450 [Caulobacterales bacterium]
MRHSIVTAALAGLIALGLCAAPAGAIETRKPPAGHANGVSLSPKHHGGKGHHQPRYRRGYWRRH